ncbi:unnamed protein product [Lactuca saligna]|uniref:Transposase-associated domain-containing protein n=1 Tax=Lactuca saligna TaxID=75948 RepID=A0AA35ZVQ3_LACSI|nr:unnamed protein product [Lactuca saligna]
MDKSWTKITNKVDPKFMKGAIAFAEMAKGYVDSEGRTHCPCKSCLNVRKHAPDVVCSHIIHHGFQQSYKILTFHRESRQENEINNEHDESDNESDDGVDALLGDAFHVGAETEGVDENDEDESNNRSSNPNVEKLFANMEKPLFPGCDTFSVLGFILRLMHVKENSELQLCPVCGASRWVDDKMHQKKIPTKVLRYFPITSRLKRLYASRYTAKDMQWHAHNKSKEDGVLRYPADGKAWKHFDTIYPDFAKEPRNQYAEQMKHNRGKLVIPSRGGSRSITNHKFAMTNKETQMPPSPIELYHKLHFDPIKKWINDESRIQYENILQLKEEECAKLVSAGTSITQETEYDIEKKVIKTICAKHKTLQSGWEASSGPVMRKKDIHLLSTAETSQSASKDEEDMKSKIVALEEEVRINEQKVKQSEEKCEKMLQFIISKFPDSQNILCPPDEDEARAYDDITDLSEQA